MAALRITNTHIHTFTAAHVPRYYPHPALYVFKRVPGLVRGLAWLLRVAGHPAAETLERLLQFQKEAYRGGQAEIFASVRRQYPPDTRFVVLPMDMAPIGHGPVEADIEAQHDELSRLARSDAFRGSVIPFASIHPDRPGAAAEVRRVVERLHFRGLKLYPRLGFPPDHPVLMNEIYPFLVEHDLPVMSHCSRGGVRGRDVSVHAADRFTEPAAFIPVMRKFPDLRICLAHLGGVEDWRRYAEDGIDPDDPAARAANWQVAIRDMITSGDWPNLWTDISYTLFRFEENIAFLRLFLSGGARAEALSRRVLFGSDFYMTRQEALSERAVCFRLRNALGEETFRRIAETNPEIWLGERGGDA
ncbi:hypothetical protein DDZ14_13360 [Maritimibacter sp. 55A14]|uniref:amidohydrolase family protein n=1 Tax=Maritimibacter sp. 55A14 TaxID=2174844 RepID=UPI000D6157E3|nr:amidohydrolase family protein [Maritimibacter sp. 55A14]PWE31343.1 hypothetical protein DDZ14_13360 [Maritimibacter sp. 55A14]